MNSNLTTNEIVGKDFFDLVEKNFMSLAPPELSAVTFTRGGQAVEKAIMTAIAVREMNDTTSRFTALGFRGAIHGLKTSFLYNHFRQHHKLPHMNWPIIDYPKS